MNRLLYTLLLSGFALSIFAEKTDRDFMREGNRLYRDSLFAKAEVMYKKALELNPRNARARFNYGNTLLHQQKAEEAIKQYEEAVAAETNKQMKGQMYYNMGVVMQSAKQFAPAIECYKNALRNNPADNWARYNMALCQRQLKNQPPQNQQNQKEQDEKNKQKEDKSPSDVENSRSDADSKNPKNDLSKQNAEQLLNVATQAEKRTQEKVKKADKQPQPRIIEKNW